MTLQISKADGVALCGKLETIKDISGASMSVTAGAVPDHFSLKMMGTKDQVATAQQLVQLVVK